MIKSTDKIVRTSPFLFQNFQSIFKKSKLVSSSFFRYDSIFKKKANGLAHHFFKILSQFSKKNIEVSPSFFPYFDSILKKR